MDTLDFAHDPISHIVQMNMLGASSRWHPFPRPFGSHRYPPRQQLEQIHMQSPALFASLSHQGRFPAQIQHPAFTGKFEYDGRIPPPSTRNFRVGNPGQGQAGMFMGKGFSGANGLITPGESRPGHTRVWRWDKPY